MVASHENDLEEEKVQARILIRLAETEIESEND